MIRFDQTKLIMLSDGGEAIRAAVRQAYVWTVWSTENRATCESLWASNLSDQISLTIMAEDAPMPHDLGTMVDLAIEHHGVVASFDIIGYGNVADADAVMAEYDYVRGTAHAGLSYRPNA